MLRCYYLFFLFAPFFINIAPAFALPQDAIVKIFTTAKTYRYDTPWQIAGVEELTGSGCIIAGRRILTNAHVVSNATHIEVGRNGDPERYPARVVAVAHEADLALLEVADPAFYADVAPLEFGELPELLDSIVVYGFPTGGDGLSVTKGIISRIEMTSYIHSILSMLGLQVDAAVNSGNSGGPALMDGKIVGIVMQTLPSAENIGYLVPTPVIAHFLRDLEDGRYDGFPDLGAAWQPLENRALRIAAGMTNGGSGVYVSLVVADSAADGLIQPGDVLLAIDGQPIANDGSVLLRPGLRVALDYLVAARQKGETALVSVLRQGQRLEIAVALRTGRIDAALVGYPEYDRDPEYYILGGLVLMPLTVNFLQSWGDKWLRDAPSNLLRYLDREREHPGEQVVVISSLLTSGLTGGYTGVESCRVVAVNGKAFASFRELTTLLDAALAGSAPIILETEEHSVLAFLPQEHRAQIGTLLETYGIPKAKRVRGEAK